MDKFKESIRKVGGFFAKRSVWIVLLSLVFVGLCVFEGFQVYRFTFEVSNFSYEANVSSGKIISFLKDKANLIFDLEVENLDVFLVIFSVLFERIILTFNHYSLILINLSLITCASIAVSIMIIFGVVRKKGILTKVASYSLGVLLGICISLSFFIWVVAGISFSAMDEAQAKALALPSTLIDEEELSKKKVLSGVDRIVASFENDNQKTITKITENVSKKDVVDIYFSKTYTEQMNFVDVVAVPVIISEFPEYVEGVNVDFMLYEDGELVVYDFDRDKISSIMPVVATRLITSSFSKYNISLDSLPEFYFLSEEEFGEKQAKKEEEIKGELRSVIAEIDSYVRDADRRIAYNNSLLNSAEVSEDRIDDFEDYVDEQKDVYNKYCKGAYKNHPNCKAMKDQIKSYEASIERSRKQLSQMKSDLRSYNANINVNKQKALGDLREIKEILESIENNPIKPEYLLGVFFGDDNEVCMKWVENEKKSFSFYLSTGIHEYAHALTFEKDSAWSVFLEESMTEFISTKALVPVIGAQETVNDLGYVDELRVLNVIFKHFSQDELERLYFTDKSAKGFVDIFSEVIKDKELIETLEKEIEALFFVPLDDRESREKLLESIEGMLGDVEEKNEE